MTPVAAITGIGVVAAGGIGKQAFWDLLTSGRSSTRPISLFDATGFRSRIAAECDFDPAFHGLTDVEIGRMDRAAQFAVVATREAIRESGILDGSLDPGRMSVSLGSAVGNTMSLEREYTRLTDHGREWLARHQQATADLYGYMVPSSLATEVAWDVGAEGPVALISTGCTSGLDAVGHGVQLIEEGTADVVVAGATDAPISPISVACFDAIRATSANNDDPEHASRPFDRHRDGFVLGEGSAVVVLESVDHARRRGASIYAEISGFANRSNAYHMTGLTAKGLEMAEAIRIAMRNAKINCDEIDYINAHGSSTRQNDRHETAAFKASLGHNAYRTPVSSIKSMIGHSLGAIGSIEIAACALAIRNGVIPPTANLRTPDPECDLDYVPLTARQTVVDVALTVGSGFGGFQSAMLLTAPGKARR